MGRLIRAALLVYAATVIAVLLTQILWVPSVTSADRADAIICLGAGMESDLSPLPDDVSRGRALTCAGLQMSGVAPMIVFTGAGNDVTSAADAMAAVARAAGVPHDAIIVEPEAHSTIQNAGFSSARLPGDAQSVVLVSDAFHLPRAWVIFRVLSDAELRLHATHSEVTAPLFTRVAWSLREAIVIWVNVGRLATYGVSGALGIDRDTRISWFN